jgi:hypothetical protein
MINPADQMDQIMRMKIALLASLISSAPFTCLAQEDESLWRTDTRYFACPAKVILGQQLTLKKSKLAGGELGVIGPDGKFLLLTVGSPDKRMRPFISSERLAKAESVVIDTRTVEGLGSEARARSTKVFRYPGIYRFVISGNLESDEGGFECVVKAEVRRSAPVGNIK